MNGFLELLKEQNALADWITAAAVLVGAIVWMVKLHQKRSDREHRLYSSVRELIELSLQAKKNRERLLKGIAKLKALHPIHEDTREGMERMLKEGAFTVPGTSSETRRVQDGKETVVRNDPAFHYRKSEGGVVICGSEEDAWRGLAEDLRDELMLFLDENSLREDLKA